MASVSIPIRLALVRALEDGGVVFIPAGEGGAGVMLAE
jgi:hypothetical protein